MRKSDLKGRKMARPEKKIDWDLVDELLMANCHGTEIAPHFNMHYNTFYNRVQQEHGIGFSEYSLIKKQQGDSILRRQQFLKALGKSTEGDNTLLIWLGKNRLGQKETHEPINSPFQADLNKDDIIFRQQAELAKLKQNQGDDVSQ